MMTQPATATGEDEAAVGASAWTPGPGVLHHSQAPPTPGRAYFAGPPPEIGEVLTADSTLRLGRRPMPVASRLLLAGLIGSVAASAVHFAMPADFGVLEFPAAVVAAGLSIVATRFRHHCRYVGRLGTARFTCSGRPDRLVRAEVTPFSTLSELRASQTPHYHNGAYLGTRYAYVWTDADGRPRLTLKGSYWGEKRPPKPSSPFHHVESTEAAWTQYVLERAPRVLDRDGSVRFRLDDADSVSIGPGFLETVLRGRSTRTDAADLAGLTLDGGNIVVRRRDATDGWISRSGVFRLPYAKLANARAFLLLASEWLSPPG